MNNQQLSSVKQLESTFFDRNKLLGSGKYGQVYLGFCQANKTFQSIKNIPVAVKVINLDKLVKQSEIPFQTIEKRLYNQITNLQLVQSQNVVKLYDLKQSKKNFYFICQLCNGFSFDTYLKKKGRLTETQAIRFFKDIISGFRHLHQKGIVHRDLKPANLLMHDYSLKIADLGLSKCTKAEFEMLNSIVGTPMYMSPQIFEGKYTYKTDIWSLGIILYEMIYGMIPWKVKNLADYRQKIKHEKIKFPSHPEVTQKTKVLIKNMLEVEQQKRVNWQVLSEQFLNNKSQKNKQNAYPYISFKNYVSEYPVIQSTQQIIRVLKQLQIMNIQTLNQLTQIKFKNHQDFFSRYTFLAKNAPKIQQISQYYLWRRNRICYLFFIFFEAMDFIKSQVKIGIEIKFQLHKTMFLIYKFAQSSLIRMLKNNQQFKKEDIELFQITTQRIKIGKLLENDLKVFNSFYPFYFQFFKEQIQNLGHASPQIMKEINTELGALYSQQEGDYKFIKFLKVNTMRTLFNQLKKQSHNDSLAKITILIYQFQKDTKLFDLSAKDALKNDLNKKYQTIRQKAVSHQKIKNWNQFSTQSVLNFISKEFKWDAMDSIFMSSIMDIEQQ